MRGRVMTSLAAPLLMLCTTTWASSPAFAQEEAGVCVVGVAQLHLHAGDIVMVTGDHFPTDPPTVPIMYDSTRQIGVAQVGAGGHFANPVTIPDGAVAGEHRVSVACATTNVDTTAPITVLAAGETAPIAANTDARSNLDPLVRTGSDSEPLVLAGVGAVAIGLALVLTARRRRAQRLTV